jgi:hypothetical protein
MAVVNVEGNAGGKDIPLECGTVKVSFMTQTSTVGGEISPKGVNRVVGVICGFGNVAAALLAGYSSTTFAANTVAEDKVSITGEVGNTTHYLVFGY